jgi:hypothetical protein
MEGNPTDSDWALLQSEGTFLPKVRRLYYLPENSDSFFITVTIYPDRKSLLALRGVGLEFQAGSGDLPHCWSGRLR